MDHHQNYLTDASIRRIVRDHERLQQQFWNLTHALAEMRRREPRPGEAPQWFRNDSGEEMPANSIGAVKDRERNLGREILVVTKPSVTFRQQHIISRNERVVDGGVARIQTGEFLEIAHDSAWTPANGDRGGPKPGSWLLFENYPAICSVVGPVAGATDILLGTLSMIDGFIGKTTSAFTAGETDDTYTMRIGFGATAGYTTVPDGTTQIPFDNDIWIKGGWIGGKLVLEPLECNA